MPFPEPPPGDDPVRAAFHDALRATPEPADLDLRADLGLVVGRARTRRRRRRGLTVVAAATTVALLAGGVALAASTGEDGGASHVIAGDGDDEAATPTPDAACPEPPAAELAPSSPADAPLVIVPPGGSAEAGAAVAFAVDGAAPRDDWTWDGTTVLEQWDGTAWAGVDDPVVVTWGDPAPSVDGTSEPSTDGIRARAGRVVFPTDGPAGLYRVTVPVTVFLGGDVQTFDLRAVWTVGCAGTATTIAECSVPELWVFLDVRIEPGRGEAVRVAMDALASDGVLADVRYVDQAASLAEFRALFADEPEVLAGVDVGDVPTSLRATVDPDRLDEVHAALEALPGVTVVHDRVGPGTCGVAPGSDVIPVCADTAVTPETIDDGAVLLPCDGATTTTTTAARESCPDLLATTTTTSVPAGVAVDVVCAELDPSTTTSETTTSPSGPAGPAGGCPVVDLEARTVELTVAGHDVVVAWSVPFEHSGPAAGSTTSDVGLHIGIDEQDASIGYDRDVLADTHLVSYPDQHESVPAWPPVVVGVVADGYQLAPPREIGDGAATTWPTLWTDVIPELGGHLFVTAAGTELTVVATSGVYDIVCGEIAATDEPR